MNFDNIQFENKGGIAILTINRPSKLNALNKATIQELHEAFTAAEIDEEVKVIILTASGEKAFVAGADIAEFAGFAPILANCKSAFHGEMGLVGTACRTLGRWLSSISSDDRFMTCRSAVDRSDPQPA